MLVKLDELLTSAFRDHKFVGLHFLLNTKDDTLVCLNADRSRAELFTTKMNFHDHQELEEQDMRFRKKETNRVRGRQKQVDFVLTKKCNLVYPTTVFIILEATYLDRLDGILNLIDTTLRREGVNPTIVLLFT